MKMRPNNLLYMPGVDQKITEIVVMKLHDFWEARRAILALREGKVVILLLSELESNQMQRAVDLITGSTCAINGYAKRIGLESSSSRRVNPQQPVKSFVR